MNYKGYIIKPHPIFPSMLLVATEGRGGKVPNMLTGMFTDHGLVKKLIDQYIAVKGA